ncbi:histone deacetylase [Niveibacterium sp. 24ML]|uniref:histone deacetylase family protein n=1 Tax=Niveibacterium sp. 24ML TaxID=2985512 RepID=UPI00227085FA|nr:histone deacetylase [Niveibacterium sp. 24ML]MCX9158473.1 histone deacetylase [Niveibacterium sp. 24ML]
MKLYYADHFVLPLPEGHRFPMAKYRMLRDELAACGRFSPDDFCEAPAASREALRLAHSDDYVRRVCAGQLTDAEIRRIGFPWTNAMVERSRRSAGATIAACRSALADGCAANLAGGTHHAHHDFGSGFCVFNDAAIAARVMQHEAHIARVAIIDCDVHQGDGTAAIFAADPSVFTFSIHGQKNFPFRKQTSDLDIELPDACADAAYLDMLTRGLETVFAKSRPELVIYLAGADPYLDDRLGRLGLSMAGLLARDRLVLDACKLAQVPVALAMAGGYARNIADTVAIHASTIRLAHDRNYS